MPDLSVLILELTPWIQLALPLTTSSHLCPGEQLSVPDHNLSVSWFLSASAPASVSSREPVVTCHENSSLSYGLVWLDLTCWFLPVHTPYVPAPFSLSAQLPDNLLLTSASPPTIPLNPIPQSCLERIDGILPWHKAWMIVSASDARQAAQAQAVFARKHPYLYWCQLLYWFQLLHPLVRDPLATTSSLGTNFQWMPSLLWLGFSLLSLFHDFWLVPTFHNPMFPTRVINRLQIP